MENDFIFCQKCGVKNSKNGKYCQNCAAPLNDSSQQTQQVQSFTPPIQPQNIPNKKKNKGCLIAVLVVVGLLILVVVLASKGGKSSEITDANSNTVTTTQKKQEPLVVSVDTLVDELNENALKASNAYKGKYVKLTGRLSVVDSSGDYFSLQPLNDDFSLDTVLCNINQEHLDTVSNFTSEQEVTVIGTITNVGEVMGYSLDVESIE